jgi:hypothetical protein
VEWSFWFYLLDGGRLDEECLVYVGRLWEERLDQVDGPVDQRAEGAAFNFCFWFFLWEMDGQVIDG